MLVVKTSDPDYIVRVRIQLLPYGRRGWGGCGCVFVGGGGGLSDSVLQCLLMHFPTISCK